MLEPVTIRRYLDVDVTPQRVREIDRIFFESSNTKSFENEDVRRAFRQRWLGRYLSFDPAFAYLALDGNGAIAGYLVGAIDDPALATRFADISYFATLAEHTKRYPAHLHVNVSPGFRDRGIGGRLVEAFADDARAAGVPGMHVVTSADAANVRFYNRSGFLEVARTGKGGSLVFLARSL